MSSSLFYSVISKSRSSLGGNSSTSDTICLFGQFDDICSNSKHRKYLVKLFLDVLVLLFPIVDDLGGKVVLLELRKVSSLGSLPDLLKFDPRCNEENLNWFCYHSTWTTSLVTSDRVQYCWSWTMWAIVGCNPP